jgi:hypothetical protein
MRRHRGSSATSRLISNKTSVGAVGGSVRARKRGYNLDIKNPHTVADDHGDPETLLADLNAAEAETATLRDHLKAILAEALAGVPRSSRQRGSQLVPWPAARRGGL